MPEEKKTNVELDGKEVTREELEEKQKDQSIRIVEDGDNPGKFKTLQKIYG